MLQSRLEGRGVTAVAAFRSGCWCAVAAKKPRPRSPSRPPAGGRPKASHASPRPRRPKAPDALQDFVDVVASLDAGRARFLVVGIDPIVEVQPGRTTSRSQFMIAFALDRRSGYLYNIES